MINTFGANPTTVPVLMQFLTLLPEEVHTNSKIPITVSPSLSITNVLLKITSTGL